MKSVIQLIVVTTLVVLACFSCTQKRPTMPDAVGNMTIVAIDTSGTYSIEDSSKYVPVSGATVHLDSKEYIKKNSYLTGGDGRLELNGVIASQYDINVTYPLDPQRILTGGTTLNIFSEEMVVDTVKLAMQTLAPVLINELYYAGPQNRYYFFYDQYVELYNRTDSTVYLDGMVIGRIRSNTDMQPLKDKLPYIQLVYAYKFAGNPGEKNVPLGPGQYAVIAADATDHSKSCPGALNLENADFEFCNQIGNDYDNRDVPNLDNINPSRTSEFLISLASDGVILTNGLDWKLEDVDESTYVTVPVETVVDGVEYKSGTSLKKYLTVRVDAGYAGVGITKYSGMSVQRLNPNHDTNNSSVDFHNLNSPTPGY